MVLSAEALNNLLSSVISNAVNISLCSSILAICNLANSSSFTESFEKSKIYTDLSVPPTAIKLSSIFLTQPVSTFHFLIVLSFDTLIILFFANSITSVTPEVWSPNIVKGFFVSLSISHTFIMASKPIVTTFPLDNISAFSTQSS